MKFLIFLSLVAWALCFPVHKRFAILMTGTVDQYDGGYRHQADVAHAFHIFKNAGVPLDNMLLITPNNTYLPDVFYWLFNWPSCNTTDVRPGLAINSTFNAGLSVFNQQAKSAFSLEYFEHVKPYPEPDDAIFIYVVGHGQPGIWSFGNEYWYADDIMGMLRNLTIRWPYVDVLLMVDTCYAASVFENELFANNHTFYYNGTYIPHRIMVIAAAHANEESFAYFCGKPILHGYYMTSVSCIADEFSYQWMWFMENYNMTTSTVEHMLNFTIRQTIESEPVAIGNINLHRNRTLDWFIGPDKPRMIRVQEDPIYCYCDAPNWEDVIEVHGECQAFRYRNGSWYTNFPDPSPGPTWVTPYPYPAPYYTNTPAPTSSPPIPLPYSINNQIKQGNVDDDEEDYYDEGEEEGEQNNGNPNNNGNNGHNNNNGNSNNNGNNGHNNNNGNPNNNGNNGHNNNGNPNNNGNNGHNNNNGNSNNNGNNGHNNNNGNSNSNQSKPHPIFGDLTREEWTEKGLKEYMDNHMTDEQRNFYDRLPAFLASHGNEFNMAHVRKDKRKLKYLELLSRVTDGEFQEKWQQMYDAELDLETRIDTFFQRFNKTVDLTRPVTKVENWDCYKQSIERFDKRFGKSSYGFSQFHLLATMCNQKPKIYKKI